MKVLVRGPNWLGDHVLAMPLYAALRETYPTARLTLMAPPSVLEVPCAFFDDKIPLESWRALKARGFDRALTLPASVSSAFLLWRAAIPVREGFAEFLARPFLTRAFPWPGRRARRHKADLYFTLAGTDAKPKAALAQASQKRQGIVLAPGASIPLREWPQFREYLVRLRERLPGERFRLVGSAREAKWSAFVKRHPELAVEDLIGKTTIPELVLTLAEAEIVVAMDSGPAHLAAGLGHTPTLVIFGPGDPEYIAPRGAPVLAVRPDVACAPCESSRCRGPFGYQACLKGISPGAVVDKTVDWLLTARRYTPPS